MRSDSISSPKSSTRTGLSQSGANRSTMPPRRAKWPGESMTPEACQPRAASQSASSPGSSRPPTSSRRVLATMSRGSSRGESSACTLVTMMAGRAPPGIVSRLTTSSRAAAVGSSPTMPLPSPSSAGNRATGSSVNRGRSAANDSAAESCGSTTTSTPRSSPLA